MGDPKKKEDVKRPQDLRGKKAEIDDDLEEAEAKSGSVDERIDRFRREDVGAEAPVPAAHIPQSGIAIPKPGQELGKGEAILEQERKAQRTPRRPG